MNIKIGKGNIIDDSVVIHDNVTIGDNNVIKAGTVIYENTIIGDNNTIFENNEIGTLVVDANVSPDELKRNGLIVGNNNFFHIHNTISSGFYRKTIIGNNNKFLSHTYISHDNIIHNNVVFYPKVFTAGLVEIFDFANLGACCCIHQKIKVGSYSMIGMNCSIVKNVLPFFINVNNRYTNINHKRLENFSNDVKEKLEYLFYLASESCNIELGVIDDEIDDPYIKKCFKQILVDTN